MVSATSSKATPGRETVPVTVTLSVPPIPSILMELAPEMEMVSRVEPVGGPASVGPGRVAVIASPLVRRRVPGPAPEPVPPLTVQVDAGPTISSELAPAVPPSKVIGAAIRPRVASTLSAVASVAEMSRLFTCAAGLVSAVAPLTLTTRSEPAALTPMDWPAPGAIVVGGGATVHGARNVTAMGSLFLVVVPVPSVTGVEADTLTTPCSDFVMVTVHVPLAAVVQVDEPVTERPGAEIVISRPGIPTPPSAAVTVIVTADPASAVAADDVTASDGIGAGVGDADGLADADGVGDADAVGDADGVGDTD